MDDNQDDVSKKIMESMKSIDVKPYNKTLFITAGVLIVVLLVIVIVVRIVN